jgi:fatty aldehyde-generating acyl-ACP reductase
VPPWGKPLEFALIGHQATWAQTCRIVQALRTPDRPPLPDETIREIVPWIPPRPVVRTTFCSLPSGGTVDGVYLETFITPDELIGHAWRRALGKVRDAMRCAAALGVKVAALGGFTSILLEGREEEPPPAGGPAFTTGNSLTAAFIVKGMERAAAQRGVALEEATLLIVGATGDIGSACSRYFAGRTRRLILSARQPDRLARLATELDALGATVQVLPVADALREADAIISVASLSQPTWDPAACRPAAIICDAGYPKNLRAAVGEGAPNLFHGGMGVVRGGWVNETSVLEGVYDFPAPFVAHGCLLEAVVLAFERRYQAYSSGRGFITPARIEEIYGLADRHGIELAPFFNHDGLWSVPTPAATKAC